MSVFIATEELPGATESGTNPAGVWMKRSLNTVRQPSPGCSLSDGEVTLPGGSWKIEADALGYGALRCQTRLYNVTASATMAAGLNARSELENTLSRVVGFIDIPSSETRTIRLEQWFQQAKTVNGLGVSNRADSGINAVFSQLVATKV